MVVENKSGKHCHGCICVLKWARALSAHQIIGQEPIEFVWQGVAILVGALSYTAAVIASQFHSLEWNWTPLAPQPPAVWPSLIAKIEHLTKPRLVTRTRPAQATKLGRELGRDFVARITRLATASAAVDADVVTPDRAFAFAGLVNRDHDTVGDHGINNHFEHLVCSVALVSNPFDFSICTSRYRQPRHARQWPWRCSQYEQAMLGRQMKRWRSKSSK